MKTEIISISFFKLLFQPSVVACFFLNYFLFSDCPFSQPCFGNPLWSSFLLQFFTYFYAHIQIKDLRKHWFHPHFFLGTIAVLQRLPVLWHSTGVNLRFSICITCSGHINVYTNGNIIIIYIVLWPCNPGLVFKPVHWMLRYGCYRISYWNINQSY